MLLAGARQLGCRQSRAIRHPATPATASRRLRRYWRRNAPRARRHAAVCRSHPGRRAMKSSSPRWPSSWPVFAVKTTGRAGGDREQRPQRFEPAHDAAAALGGRLPPRAARGHDDKQARRRGRGRRHRARRRCCGRKRPCGGFRRRAGPGAARAAAASTTSRAALDRWIVGMPNGSRNFSAFSNAKPGLGPAHRMTKPRWPPHRAAAARIRRYRPIAAAARRRRSRHRCRPARACPRCRRRRWTGRRRPGSPGSARHRCRERP